MIQFNLLPDVKLEFIKARRLKRLVTFVSVIVAGTVLVIFIFLLLFVDLFQKHSINSLSSTIKTDSNNIRNIPNLDKILTVQNQLNALPALHDKKPVTSRLFTYLSQVTPTQASISSLDIDFTQNTISISGAADSLSTVNTYVDTLKFTTYSTKATSQSQATSGTKAFSNVVLSSFARSSTGASYTITLNFDPIIFSEDSDVTLTVPNIISTRSEVDQPPALFQKSQTTQGVSNGQ